MPFLIRLVQIVNSLTFPQMCRSFKKDGTDTFEVIDIPNDTRGDRLIIAEDTISLNSQGDIKRGMLLIMIFDPTEDTGEYKCKGVYDTHAFDDIDTSFEISEYAVNSNGKCQSLFFFFKFHNHKFREGHFSR